jgi:hypothetical protein
VPTELPDETAFAAEIPVETFPPKVSDKVVDCEKPSVLLALTPELEALEFEVPAETPEVLFTLVLPVVPSDEFAPPPKPKMPPLASFPVD